MRLLTATIALLPALALAGGFRDAVEDASDAMDAALAQARRSGGACRPTMKGGIDKAIDDVDELLTERGERRLPEVRSAVAGLAQMAPRAGCPEGVAKKLSRAVERLDDAQARLAERRDRREDREERRDRDERGDGRRQRVSTPVEFGNLRITSMATANNEPVVQVDVPEVRFHELLGLRFRLAARVRSQNGQPGEWTYAAQYQIPSAEYVWPNAQTFSFRHAVLRGMDTAGGRFVVRVSVIDERNQELGSVEQAFELAGALAPAPPPGTPEGVGPHHRPIPVIVRDCGTGQDPGCSLSRNGVTAMDAATFNGLMTSLKNTTSEMTREQMVEAALRANGFTAAQLGLVLDQFRSEISKLNVARRAAPKVTNPQHAIGFSVKFRSGINQAEYVRLMTAQQ